MRYLLILFFMLSILFSCSRREETLKVEPVDSIVRIIPKIKTTFLKTENQIYDTIAKNLDSTGWQKRAVNIWSYDFENDLNQKCSFFLKSMYEDDAQYGELEFMCWIVNMSNGVTTELDIRKAKLSKLYNSIKEK